MKSKKSILIVVAAIATVILLFFTGQRQNSTHFLAATLNPFQGESQSLVAAACPTFYYLLDEFKENGFEAIETASTAESLYYLEQDRADLIIAGRALKPKEPQFPFKVVGRGYSFIADKEFVVSEKEMGDYNFFTDLSAKKIIDDFPYITEDRIKEIKNVYDYLSNGIIITSFENTDYSKSKIVHIYKENGSRHRFSRTPVIYYRKGFDLKILP